MANSIDDIIKLGIKRELEVNDENKGLYVEYLEEQLREHKYDLDFVDENIRDCKFPYVDLLADKLYIFCCLTRRKKVKREIIETGETEEVFLNEDKKLHLLKIGSTRPEDWEDNNLFRLYRRRNKAHQDHKAKNYPGSEMKIYSELIDEIGAHPKVVEIWERSLTYKNDMFFMQPKRIMR